MPTITADSPHRRRAALWLALLVGGALIRGLALWIGGDGLHRDPDGYLAMSQRFIDRGALEASGSPSAYRPPLYPLLLAGWGMAFGLTPAAIAVLHWLLGAATVMLALVLGRQWELGAAAYLGAILVACDPILLNQSAQVMTETLATFLAAAALVALAAYSIRPANSTALVAGLILALAALCRPTFLLWGAATVAAMAWFAPRQSSDGRPRTRIARMLPGLACAIGLAAGLAPWGIRNWVQIGAPVVTTTHGGYTLWLANNRDFYAFLRSGGWGEVWTSEAVVDRWRDEVSRLDAKDELARDRLAYQLARHDIGAEPGMFAYACIVRLGRFWGVAPHRTQAGERTVQTPLRWCVGLVYALEHLLMLAGVVALWRRPGPRGVWLWGVLLIACLSAAHLLYWTDMRMRAPAAPAACLLAAAGAASVWNRWRRRKPL